MIFAIRFFESESVRQKPFSEQFQSESRLALDLLADGRDLVNGAKEAGWHEVEWDGKNDGEKTVSTGLYVYRLETPDQTRSLKMVYTK